MQLRRWEACAVTSFDLSLQIMTYNTYFERNIRRWSTARYKAERRDVARQLASGSDRGGDEVVERRGAGVAGPVMDHIASLIPHRIRRAVNSPSFAAPDGTGSGDPHASQAGGGFPFGRD